jgi:hypothetical protein
MLQEGYFIVTGDVKISIIDLARDSYSMEPYYVSHFLMEFLEFYAAGFYQIEFLSSTLVFKCVFPMVLCECIKCLFYEFASLLFTCVMVRHLLRLRRAVCKLIVYFIHIAHFLGCQIKSYDQALYAYDGVHLSDEG